MANGGGAADLIPGMSELPATSAGTAGPGGAGRPAGRAAKAAKAGNAGRKGARRPAGEMPVGRVAVDMSLPHLDRLFDYLIPAELDGQAVPGCRVRVRFAGRLVDGFLLERAERSEHDGRLAFVERVVSPEPVLAPEIAALAREVADRYAGTFADVLRLAVPPRHARAERETVSPDAANEDPANDEMVSPDAANEQAGGEQADGEAADGGGAAGEGSDREGGDERPAGDDTPGEDAAGEGAAGEGPTVPPPGPWAAYPSGTSFLSALTEGRAPRAVWTAAPGPGWPAAIARAVRAAVAGGRGALVVVADGRDVARVGAALGAEFAAAAGPAAAGPPAAGPAAAGPGPVDGDAVRCVALTAELGPAERYRRWLAVRRGHATVVVGTRAAMFAPVARLGLVVLWDDGDDVHAEQHAPYPHAREVLALRAHRAGAGALIGGFARTTDATRLVETGWAHALVPDRAMLRASMPRVLPAGDDTELARDEAARIARLPDLALRTARRALEHGPVLVQVPRRGYLPAVACARCRSAARCDACQGPLAVVSSHAAPHCRWCGRIAGAWTCGECGGRQVRAVAVGARRTAEELGRAFPGIPVRTSGRDGVVDRVGPEPRLIVATPGAEPVASDGYAGALLLDGRALLGRADLRATEEALRRWMNAAALVRPAGGVVVLADGALPAVQALLRWDPVTFAERELDERRQLGFPPAAGMASLTGTPAALGELLDIARLPEGAEVLGPVPVTVRGGAEHERALVRVPRRALPDLARALKAAQGVRSARKTPETVRIQVDPLELI